MALGVLTPVSAHLALQWHQRNIFAHMSALSNSNSQTLRSHQRSYEHECYDPGHWAWPGKHVQCCSVPCVWWSVLCCLQVPFTNIRTLHVHKTLEKQPEMCFMLQVLHPSRPRHKTFTHLSLSIWQYTCFFHNSMVEGSRLCLVHLSFYCWR